MSRAIDATLDYLTSDNGETVDIGESKVDETNAVVYFVMMGNPSTVKIGKASDLQKRMRDFRLHGGIEPTVLFTLPGYTQLESEMHHRFDRYRYAGEWFRVEGALAEFINERVSEKKRQRDAIMKKCLGVLFEPDEAMH